MPVRSVKVPSRSAQPLALAAVLHGIEADPIDREDGECYIDLIGSVEKMDLVCAKVEGVEVLDTLDKVLHMEPVFTMVGRKGMED